MFTFFLAGFLLSTWLDVSKLHVQQVKYARELTKGGEIRDTVKKTLNLSCNFVSLQVLRCRFTVFTLRDQLVAQQKHLLRVEESGLYQVKWIFARWKVLPTLLSWRLLRPYRGCTKLWNKNYQDSILPKIRILCNYVQFISKDLFTLFLQATK